MNLGVVMCCIENTATMFLWFYECHSDNMIVVDKCGYSIQIKVYYNSLFTNILIHNVSFHQKENEFKDTNYNENNLLIQSENT